MVLMLLVLLLVSMLTLLAVFWFLLLRVLLMLVSPLAFPLVLQMRCCVLAVLLTLTVPVPGNLRNRVEKHWMLLCFLHVGFWVPP
jgi:hypothetical protein